ncbi:GDP-mannose 4,6-dehydratase [Gordonia amicalis]|uniref:GDP-mannose 4,6-dehydratase n=1 Tax=Gordonia amicalis TaxID=89053 RepID=UPI0002A636FA|nr:GDP-mannose 4,6-dehydratase [Gordonia amicalis]MBA5845644.1 GDP-mannose 4,6-dehydratase [Gordonia amicalis]NKX77388.1 GDP-mannose 4,6-dehydratase [Gordonia amicalis]UKO93265.1 GDP-mannose 4,6-dehydratase [Gordonia amicalis]UOG20944.1 GDP-mannose 4,6-dehydratase [Gordonia amicalis]GAC52251.1 GDP-mannose 4,6-dehydratase [Gordonia amicalis NBRC 100051 = JCM 11271]
MTPPRALVTGANGQDGHLLIEELVTLGWDVVAVVRPGRAVGRSSGGNVVMSPVDLADPESTRRVITDHAPDHIFHLGAVSSVSESWHDPLTTARVTAMSTVAILEAASALTDLGHRVHVVNASSAEIFAGSTITPQDETTPIAPASPYGAAKAYGHTMAGVARSKGLQVANAILYPHESPLRSTRFVTRKITAGVAAIAVGSTEPLVLGNLDARRDWGWAGDHVSAMITLAVNRANDDYVVATGESHSVGEFVATAFEVAGIPEWEHLVTTDPSFVRAADGVDLVGDPRRIRDEFGWRPRTGFTEVVEAMVRHDLALLGADQPRRAAIA